MRHAVRLDQLFGRLRNPEHPAVRADDLHHGFETYRTVLHVADFIGQLVALLRSRLHALIDNDDRFAGRDRVAVKAHGVVPAR